MPLLEKLLAIGESQSSPIVDTLIRSISNKTAARDAKQKRILLASDLYEHSSHGSLYFYQQEGVNKLTNVNSKRLLGLQGMLEVVKGHETSLAAAKLQLVLIRREKQWQHQQIVKDLWMQFLKSLKIEVTLDPI